MASKPTQGTGPLGLATPPREPDSSLADQAYREIRMRILDLRLYPGQTILIDELAGQLGMSRTPVREAVARLRLEGLVTTVPRKGMVVTIPTVEMIREVYEVMEGIEGQAVKLAAERADGAMLRSLEESVAEQEKALAADDLAAWMKADLEFHYLMIEAAGNERMREVARLFRGQLYRLAVATLRLRPKPYQSVRDHRALVEALRTRDGEEARQIHFTHLDRAYHEVASSVASFAALVLRASSESEVGRAAGPR